jgi:hypothetical protein
MASGLAADGCIASSSERRVFCPRSAGFAQRRFAAQTCRLPSILKECVMATKEKYRVIELYAPVDPLPRYVEASRVDREAPWRTTYRHRDELDTKLALWCRELAARNQEPVERCLLGRNVTLHEKCAREVARFRVEEIARMSGSWPDLPEFLCNKTHPGGRGCRRPVWANGVMHASMTAAAKAAGVTRRAVWDRLRHSGWNWA